MDTSQIKEALSKIADLMDLCSFKSAKDSFWDLLYFALCNEPDNASALLLFYKLLKELLEGLYTIAALLFDHFNPLLPPGV
ncbi:hypothetical protein HGH93_08655 [Chitinophaga polysaccharea]|uniref:hypothetical protein n=1 Tax=Chitinophaga polysaccharea TaxID=1293035 RepID=UPI001455BA35|nr:hypothetical protein [Chitinophaga polysaccharea]NLR58165.1 hypothetical protein [Chitinophaga polysaccharea]